MMTDHVDMSIIAFIAAFSVLAGASQKWGADSRKEGFRL